MTAYRIGEDQSGARRSAGRGSGLRPDWVNNGCPENVRTESASPQLADPTQTDHHFRVVPGAVVSKYSKKTVSIEHLVSAQNQRKGDIDV